MGEAAPCYNDGLPIGVSQMTTRALAALILLAVATASAASAAEWPTRPIRIIAPSTPGGVAHTFARLLAEFLPPLLHQPVIVDNRPGAGGLIGAAAAAHAAPDGYTLVTSSVAYHVIAPAVSPSPPFDRGSRRKGTMILTSWVSANR